jgi:heme/copper-type cytochrome/quinol oxidase subunit 1
MQTLEVVRLELIHFGITLLPFVYVGLLIAGYLHWSEGISGRVRGWQGINAVVWIGGVVMSAVKVVGLSKEGITARKESKYPMSDQVIDVAVMAGVYAVIAILEMVLGFWRALRRVSSRESVGAGLSWRRRGGFRNRERKSIVDYSCSFQKSTLLIVSLRHPGDFTVGRALPPAPHRTSSS